MGITIRGKIADFLDCADFADGTSRADFLDGGSDCSRWKSVS
ncbi:MAG: hypothetical protein R3E32_12205 [Chitinophagales bacterium]